MGPPPLTDEQFKERFFEKTIPEPNSGCLLWTGATDTRGYGQMAVRRVTTSAHRIAWRLANGSIDRHQHVLHRCDTPACVNVDHLFLGTHQDNMNDMAAKGRRATEHLTKRKGELNGNSVLIEDDVRVIRRLRTGGCSLGTIALRFGISKQNVSMIVKNKTWAHVALESVHGS